MKIMLEAAAGDNKVRSAMLCWVKVSEHTTLGQNRNWFWRKSVENGFILYKIIQINVSYENYQKSLDTFGNDWA